ncbi:ABC transporter permease subunit [Bradyrhizobium sp. IC3069]|uniref:ABC transporter permease n=1 Tax=unclassified Bradyrhizobium TaxID=2631580 RepID=UPI001CD538F0|nr:MULTISPECIES: ABC transporter permease subunit [unclassified Bradyrhizobium]MCA1363367.1 ABC transporter permease subunit [Bradyrhizobium sp. IC4059]MCA1520905.1 ABC transporter permease subunit [Bradyrhizobium sp. IC3069]
MKATRSKLLLLLPAVTVFVLFLLAPILMVLNESIRTFDPGRIGSVAGAPLTFANYAELFLPVYLQYFAQTYFLAFCASLIAVVFAFPIAYCIARSDSPWARKASISAIVGLMFLSALVRVYALELTLGAAGVLAPIMSSVGINTNGRSYIDFVIVAGLLHYAIPMSILILIGAIQNLNPRLTEAAQSLGASALTAHRTVTIPLCIRGIVSAFLVSITLGVSAFVIPWVLGRGRVQFISNLIYSRFSEVANYPSGAAISIVMMALSLLLIFIMSRLATSLERT